MTLFARLRDMLRGRVEVPLTALPVPAAVPAAPMVRPRRPARRGGFAIRHLPEILTGPRPDRYPARHHRNA